MHGLGEMAAACQKDSALLLKQKCPGVSDHKVSSLLHALQDGFRIQIEWNFVHS